MSSYIGEHASLYDLFYSEKDYKKESEFINELIIEHGANNTRTVLEIACGTGNHAFELEKYGYKITAIDYSKSMIEQAAIKKAKNGSGVHFSIGDMKEIKFEKASFDNVICLFDSIGYVRTNENLRRVLTGVYDVLSDNGIFIFEFWHAAAMLQSYDPVRVKRWKLGDSDILRISETSLDLKSQSCDVCYSIYQTYKDGTYSYLEETQTNRFFLLQEMNNFLENAQFKIISNLAGYNGNKNIDENTWHILTVAQKNERTTE
jgi:ubiquinone/menaquinone biosynthesis C-methylase UbiE